MATVSDRVSRMPVWTLVAQDGAGPDGSTLYACYDDSGALRGVAFTDQPARRDAWAHGAQLRRTLWHAPEGSE